MSVASVNRATLIERRIHLRYKAAFLAIYFHEEREERFAPVTSRFASLLGVDAATLRGSILGDTWAYSNTDQRVRHDWEVMWFNDQADKALLLNKSGMINLLGRRIKGVAKILMDSGRQDLRDTGDSWMKWGEELIKESEEDEVSGEEDI